MYKFSVPPPATPPKEQYIRTLWREERRGAAVLVYCAQDPGRCVSQIHRKHRWAVLLALECSLRFLAPCPQTGTLHPRSARRRRPGLARLILPTAAAGPDPRRGERPKPACAASAARSPRARLLHALSLLREPRLVRAGTPPVVLIKGVRTGHPCPSLHSDTRRGGVPRPRSDWPLQSEGKSGPGTRARRLEPGGATHAPLGAARPPPLTPRQPARKEHMAGAAGAPGPGPTCGRRRRRTEPAVYVYVFRVRAGVHTHRRPRAPRHAGSAHRPVVHAHHAHTSVRVRPPRRVSTTLGHACIDAF